jgi:hypothetical protein
LVFYFFSFHPPWDPVVLFTPRSLPAFHSP